MATPITFKNKGDFSKSFKWMHNHLNPLWRRSLHKYGAMGVRLYVKQHPNELEKQQTLGLMKLLITQVQGVFLSYGTIHMWSKDGLI